MENKTCGCGEIVEDTNESVEDKSEEKTGCCGTRDNGESSTDKSEENTGCGCGGIDFPDISAVKNPNSPKFIASDDFINKFEEYAHSLGIKDVGYAQITPDLLIRDKFIQYPHLIVLTMEMDNEIIEAKPGPEAQKLNDSAYVKLGELSFQLSDYLRRNGFATEVAHPYGGLVKFSQLGQKAGLGWIGQNGLLISPELGPRQKISAIFVSIVNLPMKETNKHSWIEGYCDKCGKCIKACTENALIEKESCCGENETEFVQELCIGCSDGCTYCIEGCPFDQKEYTHIKERFDKMNAKLKEKKQ
jgi:ferredoxin